MQYKLVGFLSGEDIKITKRQLLKAHRCKLRPPAATKKCHGSFYKMYVNRKLIVLADCGCRAPAAGTWPTQWRRTRRRPSTAFSPGHWGKTGGGVSPASSGSGTSCGLASAIGPPSAKPAVKRQFGADFVSYCVLSFFFFF